MKTIVLLRAWVEDYMEERLRALGHRVIAFDYFDLPCEVVHDAQGQKFLSVNDKVLRKGGRPAICPTEFVNMTDGSRVLAFRSKETSLIALDEIDAVLCRVTMWRGVEKGLGILNFFEDHGVVCSETPEAYRVARSKIKTYECFAAHNISQPETLCLMHGADDMMTRARSFFQAHDGDIVAKSDLGYEGRDVYFPQSLKEFRGVLEGFVTDAKDIVLQKRIHTKGNPQHYRVEIIAGEILAADLQIAKDGELKSNLSLGASVYRDLESLTQDHKDLCIAAAQAAGINFAGMDLMIDQDGQGYIIEANITPDIWREGGVEHLNLLVDKTLESCLA